MEGDDNAGAEATFSDDDGNIRYIEKTSASYEACVELTLHDGLDVSQAHASAEERHSNYEICIREATLSRFDPSEAEDFTKEKVLSSVGNLNRMRKLVKSFGTKLDTQKVIDGGKFKNWRCSPLEQWISYRNRMLKKILAGVQTETSSYTSWT